MSIPISQQISPIPAQTAFLSSGTFMGYTFYAFQYQSLSDLSAMQYFPYFLGIIAATVTACFLALIKHRSKQEKFYQFYLLIGAIAVCIVSGFLFLFENGLYEWETAFA